MMYSFQIKFQYSAAVTLFNGTLLPRMSHKLVMIFHNSDRIYASVAVLFVLKIVMNDYELMQWLYRCPMLNRNCKVLVEYLCIDTYTVSVR